MSTLNSYKTQIALQDAIDSKEDKCKCKLSGKLEGMTLTLDEELDFVEWVNPDNNKSEYLLMLSKTPLISISKKSFDKHYDKI